MNFFGYEVEMSRSGFSFSKRSETVPLVIPAKKRGSSRSRSMGWGSSFLHAAETSHTSASWKTNPQSAGTIIEREWLPTVARSRDVMQNNSYGAKFLGMLRDNIPGPKGFTLHARVKARNGSIDKKANEEIERAWKQQRKKENWDSEGELSGAAMERLAIQSAAQDGEVIAVVEMGQNVSPTRFAVRLIDPVLLEPNYHADLTNGNVIRHGIEYNARNRKVAYHFRKYQDRYVGVLQYGGDKYERVDASQVIHIYLPWMVGAKRGLPWAKAAMWQLRQLGAYADAAVTKARVAASDMMLFENEDGELDDDDNLDFEFEVEPGVARDLPVGRKPFAFNPQYPSGEFDPFTRRMLQAASSALGVSYNTLASDLTAVNFSSIRHGTLEEREMWIGFQLWFEEYWCFSIFEKWLQHALLSNKLMIGNRPMRIERFEDYMEVAFIGRRWAWIDPTAEINGLEREIDLKLKSRSKAIRDRGEDPDEVFAEIEAEEKEMRKRGLDPAVNRPGSSPKPDSKPQDKSSKAAS